MPTSTTRPYRCAQSRLERRDSCCRAAKAPRSLSFADGRTRESRVRNGLSAGENRIRTPGPRKREAVPRPRRPGAVFGGTEDANLLKLDYVFTPASSRHRACPRRAKRCRVRRPATSRLRNGNLPHLAPAFFALPCRTLQSVSRRIVVPVRQTGFSPFSIRR